MLTVLALKKHEPKNTNQSIKNCTDYEISAGKPVFVFCIFLFEMMTTDSDIMTFMNTRSQKVVVTLPLSLLSLLLTF